MKRQNSYLWFLALMLIAQTLTLKVNVFGQQAQSKSSSEIEHCGTMQALERRLENDRAYEDFYTWANSIPKSNSKSGTPCGGGSSASDIVVPVAFHFENNVVTGNCASEDCLLAEVEDQLEALNMAFGDNLAASASMIGACPSAYMDSGGSSVVSRGTCISFCLATPPAGNAQGLDPACDPPITVGAFTGGLSTFGGTGAPGWDDILNIFIIDEIIILGPSSTGIIGVSDGIPGNANGDGVTVVPEVFGGFGGPSSCNLDDDEIYNQGATLVHEVGHYLGLWHTFQGGCSDEPSSPGPYDVNDTPPASNPYVGCNYTSCVPSSCAGGVQAVANFMDYTDDACLTMFTEQQALVMNYWANNLFAGTSASTFCDENISGMQLFSECHNLTCGCGVGLDRVVNKDAVITANQSLGGDLIIEPGATLTVKSTLEFGHDNGVVVKRGAKLILDGGVLTKCPSDPYWKGVSVWGNRNVMHSSILGSGDPELLDVSDYESASLGLYDPGMVILKNNAKIEYADKDAIATVNRSTSNPSMYWGGIVYAEDSEFYNNIRGVEFMKYDHLNYSQFRNVLFHSNLNDEFTGVSIWSCLQVHFNGCTFQANGNHTASLGIGAADGSIEVKNGCYFSDLEDGIKLHYSSPPPGLGTSFVGDPLGVLARNLFQNNETGISCLSPNLVEIVNNDFYDASPFHYGVYSSGPGTIDVEGNFFDVAFAIDYANSYLSGTSNKIHCNEINSRYGIWTHGDNRSIDLEGNNFNTTVADVFITSSGSIMGEWWDQGSASFPKINAFTDHLLAQHHFLANASQTQLFAYWYPPPQGETRVKPKCCLNYAGVGCVNPANVHDAMASNYVCEDYDGCLSDVIWQNGCLPPPNVTPPPPPTIDPDPCCKKGCYTRFDPDIERLSVLIEKGNDDELFFLLQHKASSTATYNALLEASPFLSDELLLAVMESEMLAENIASVLFRNAPLSSLLLKSAESLVSPFVFGILQSMSEKNTISERDRVQSELNRLEMERMKARKAYIACLAPNMITGILPGTTANPIPGWGGRLLTDLFEEEEYDDDIRMLYGVYLSANKYGEASKTLDEMNIKDEDDQLFIEVQRINLEILKNGGLEMTEEQEAHLWKAAEAGLPSQSYARAILSRLRDAQFSKDSQLIGEEVNHNPIEPIGKTSQSLVDWQALQISPNPVDERITIYIPYGSATGAVKLLDLQGKLIKEIEVKADEFLVTEDLTDLNDGVYFIKVDGFPAQKIIKQ